MYVCAFGTEFAVALWESASIRRASIHQLTFAKYLQMLSTVLARSWLKGQEFPAWQAPCRKNLQGTCAVSMQIIVSIEW
jgi:hypothetical protein